MASLLLELFSEEIPARMQANAAAHLHAQFEIHLMGAGLEFQNIKTFVTPRRLALVCDSVPTAQPDTTQEKKGPKTSAPQPAIDGFLRATGLPLEKLEKRMVGKDETYFAVVHSKGQPTATVLKNITEKILTDFPWPKSMRWGSRETRWVRPLHSILCLFDGQVVPVEFGGIMAGNTTHGHRFMAPDAITIKDPADYATLMKKAFVLADAEERKAHIAREAEALAAKHGLGVKRDDGLLAEVTGLVEWPVLRLGKIDDAYMDLPPEVLISEMRAHQKYFALTTKDGTMSDRFLITANRTTADDGKAVIQGNERVLRARLSDGRFFWDQDRKKPLSEWGKALKGVTFHTKIGTMAQKVRRVKYISKYLVNFVEKADETRVEKAASLCKADLVTGMVGEFPELQGVMGRYYALNQKEDAAVADAIRDHYLPLGPDSRIPDEPISICVALGDKFDTLISMFAAGEKPTGSKDPFALRRTALGIIRIILENQLRIKLKLICVLALMFYFAQDSVDDFKEKISTLKAFKNQLSIDKYVISEIRKDWHVLAKLEEKIDNQELKADIEKLTIEISTFFADRLKVQLKDQGIRHDLIAAVMAGGDDDLVRVVARARALQEFLATEDGSNLLAAYRRAANIVGIEEKKSGIKYESQIRPALLGDIHEKNLADALSNTRERMETSRKVENFREMMRQAASLRNPIDAFFTNVHVNTEDSELRANRLSILAWIRDVFNIIAHFALIEG